MCVLTWCTLAFLSMRIHELMHWVTITFSCLAFDESALLLMSLPCFWWEELEPVCFRFVSRPFVMSLYCGFSCESSNDDNVSHASRQFRCAYVHVQFRTTMLTCVSMRMMMPRCICTYQCNHAHTCTRTQACAYTREGKHTNWQFLTPIITVFHEDLFSRALL